MFLGPYGFGSKTIARSGEIVEEQNRSKYWPEAVHVSKQRTGELQSFEKPLD